VRRLALLLTAVLAIPLTACDSGEPAPSGKVRIATGSQAAVYYAYGSAMAQLIRDHLPDVQPSVLVTAASAENVNLVLAGSAEVGFTQADIAGEGAQRSPGQLVTLARLYDDYVHLVVRQPSDIHSLADLRGRRVSLGAPGSGTGITANRLLSVGPTGLADSLQREQLGLDESVTALREGRIDAFFFSGGLPVAAVDTLAKSVAIRLIDLHDYVPLLRRQFGEYYAERVVPSSTYSGVEPTLTIGIPNYLVVNATMPEPMAYALTRLLFEGRDALARAHPAGARLNVRSAISTPPLSLHAGAAHYYRDIKE
jgi:TRAP transporter TAXI family solute receptor